METTNGSYALIVHNEEEKSIIVQELHGGPLPQIYRAVATATTARVTIDYINRDDALTLMQRLRERRNFLEQSLGGMNEGSERQHTVAVCNALIHQLEVQLYGVSR